MDSSPTGKMAEAPVLISFTTGLPSSETNPTTNLAPACRMLTWNVTLL